MAQVTDPIMLDSTGQAIKNSIDLLSANINRTASNIPYDSNITVKAAIDSKVSKAGDTMTGNLIVDTTNTSTTTNDSRMYLGNNIPNGTTGSSRGVLTLYDKNQNSATLLGGDGSLTANRYHTLPDKSGTVALTSDLKEIQSGITPQGRGTGEMGLRTVTFDKPFSSVPNVVVVPYHATSPHQYIRTCTVQSVSTTGFTFVETALASDLSFYGGNVTSDPCYWIATVN